MTTRTRPVNFRSECILTSSSKRRESNCQLSVLSRLSMLQSKRQVAEAVACLGFAFLMLYIMQVTISFLKHSTMFGTTVFVATVVASVAFLPEDPFYPSLKYGWRAFTGMMIFCILCNIYALLFVHDVDSYTGEIHRLFPQSKQVLSSRTEYGIDCDPLTWQKVYAHLDIFAVAHLVGSAFKAIIFRQYKILWIYSIMWEITEYCFVHLLPNFAECWWDRVVLDVLICNGLGYYIGIQFCRMNSVQMFDWHSEKATANFRWLLGSEGDEVGPDPALDSDLNRASGAVPRPTSVAARLSRVLCRL